ncbi:PAS and ANTAR domain-containing protein [Arthrobacter sp. ISL-48]|uniref:PAS and ANTAR domain-containing protein n=1 Tax=Arthrobacter sp. ISL-48 TaxID=2819110 RepID=UPI00288C0AD4|nr:PAS and ANTAR domain-containing protein [Arthrobacter sp. ISL-48]
MPRLSSPFTYSSALGDGDLPAGTFHLDVATRHFEWSDGLFQLHGYERGEVVPTVELLLSHKHPDDRARAGEILAEVIRTGGRYCIYHRIIDARSRVHRVLTSGEGVTDAEGSVIAVDGLMLDLTATLRRETEQTAHDAVEGATATRTVIDQARGILMGRLLISSDAAFQLLVGYSSHRNRKICVVAADLLRLFDNADGSEQLEAAVRAIQEGAAPKGDSARR